MDCWLVLLSNVVKRGLELATAAALGPEPELLEACDDEEEKATDKREVRIGFWV